MKYEILLSVLNLTLLGRLYFILKDDSLEWKGIFKVGSLPFFVLPFLQFNTGWFVLTAYLISMLLLLRGVEKKVWIFQQNRGLLLIIQMILGALICSPITSLEVNNLAGNIVTFLDQVLLAEGRLAATEWVVVQGVVLGFLLVLNEMNILLRYLLELLGVKSLGDEKEQVDDEEYNTGRVIGLLERIFVFIFVLLGEFTAIGFILAAKGVARLIDLKSRDFAEYVLIGTLLSTLLAMAVGYLVRLII